MAITLVSCPCAGCGRQLSYEEVYYYGDKCEGCIRAWHDRIEAWRHGGADPELDQMYSPPAED